MTDEFKIPGRSRLGGCFRILIILSLIVPTVMVCLILAPPFIAEFHGFEGRFRDALDRSARSGGVVKVAELTDFEWERFHYFAPGTSAERIGDCLGFDWDGAGPASGGLRTEGAGFGAFTIGQTVVETARYLNELPIDEFPCGGLARSEAVFSTDPGGRLVLAD